MSEETENLRRHIICSPGIFSHQEVACSGFDFFIVHSFLAFHHLNNRKNTVTMAGTNGNGNGNGATIGTSRVKQGLAQMLKGGVIVSSYPSYADVTVGYTMQCFSRPDLLPVWATEVLWRNGEPLEQYIASKPFLPFALFVRNGQKPPWNRRYGCPLAPVAFGSVGTPFALIDCRSACRRR